MEPHQPELVLFQFETLRRLFPLPEFMRSPCVEAGLIPPLIQLLSSTDQEILLQTGRALGNICYDSRKYRRGAPGALPRIRHGSGLTLVPGGGPSEGPAYANAANIRPIAG